MEARTPASPSPPPQVPTASAPGPRAAALQKVFASAVASTIKTNSYPNFSACFPTPAKYCPSALEAVWRQINTRLEENCLREFDTILHERCIVEGLNQWDSVLEDARRRMNRSVQGEDPGRPPHMMTAQELHHAHLTPFLQQANETLEERLRTTQVYNTEMMDKILAQRAEIAQLVDGLEGVVSDIESSVEAMRSVDGQGVEELRAEVWDIEQEIRTTR